MVYRIERSPDVEPDLAAIFSHLVNSYQNFGDTYDEAEARAEKRLKKIESGMHRLAKMPFQGTLLPKLRKGLRCTTKDDGIFYFDIDERRRRIRVLAVFFSGQDHLTQILDRLRRIPV